MHEETDKFALIQKWKTKKTKTKKKSNLMNNKDIKQSWVRVSWIQNFTLGKCLLT